MNADRSTDLDRYFLQEKHFRPDHGIDLFRSCELLLLGAFKKRTADPPLPQNAIVLQVRTEVAQRVTVFGSFERYTAIDPFRD